MAASSYEATQLEISAEVSQLDEHVKRVLGIKIFLAWIIKGTVKEVSDYTPDEICQMIEGEPQIGTVPVDPGVSNSPSISGSNTEDNVPFEGVVRYDILTYLMIPGEKHPVKVLVNVEGQKHTATGYDLVTRGVYYGARRISSQKGTEFVKSDYDDLKKVYSIWLCFDSREDERNTITEYSIRKNNVYGIMPDRERYDLMSVIFIRLGGDMAAYEDGTLQAMLMVLFSETMMAEEKKRILTETYGITMSAKESEEVNVMCNYGQGIAEKNYRRGVEHGIERGIERGAEQSLNEITEIYRYLKDNGRLDEYDRGMQDPEYLKTLVMQFRALGADAAREE